MEQFTAPNTKVRVKDVRYICQNDQVHCFITMKDFSPTDPYQNLMFIAGILGMRDAANPAFRWCGSFIRPNKVSCEPSYIYNPADYEYHGVATFRPDDVYDVELAKKIAYYKAYCQMIGFYLNCYTNLYERVSSYANDVWYEQMSQLSDRYMKVNDEILQVLSEE